MAARLRFGASAGLLVARAILTTLLYEMRRRAAAGERMRYGLATLCVGVGQGEAKLIQRSDNAGAVSVSRLARKLDMRQIPEAERGLIAAALVRIWRGHDGWRLRHDRRRQRICCMLWLRLRRGRLHLYRQQYRRAGLGRRTACCATGKSREAIGSFFTSNPEAVAAALKAAILIMRADAAGFAGGGDPSRRRGHRRLLTRRRLQAHRLARCRWRRGMHPWRRAGLRGLDCERMWR